MNRIIKFRGLDFNGNWNYGYYCKDYDGICYITTLDGVDTTVVIGESVGQFTGRLDSKGIEIYEGDTNQDRGIVEWNSDDCSFIWNYPEIESCAFEGEQEWCTIAGNIHENN